MDLETITSRSGIISGIVLFIMYFIMKASVQTDGITDVSKFKGEDEEAQAKSGRNFDNAITGILVLSVILMVVPKTLDEDYFFPSIFVLIAIVLVLSTVAFRSLGEDGVQWGVVSLNIVVVFSVGVLLMSVTLFMEKIISRNRREVQTKIDYERYIEGVYKMKADDE